MSQRSHQAAVSWSPFEQLADRYDAWFDSEKGRRIFQVEADSIRALLEERPRPWLEVGVGTGRFAAALGIDDGVDTSLAVLRYAACCGIRTRVGRAEHLPYGKGSFGVTLLIVTICFLNDPAEAFRECARVLIPEGYVIVGMVPKDSPWGRAYARKGSEGHPFYSVATFYTTSEIIALADRAGFYLDRTASCLFETPDSDVTAYRRPRKDIVKGAGFVGLRFGRKGKL